MDVWGVLDLADVGPVVGELDLLEHDGGITAHDVSGPGDTLPENSVYWWKRPLVIVEHLKRDTFTSEVEGFSSGQIKYWPQLAEGPPARSNCDLSDSQTKNQTATVQTSFLTQHFRDIFNRTPTSLSHQIKSPEGRTTALYLFSFKHVFSRTDSSRPGFKGLKVQEIMTLLGLMGDEV